VRTRLAQVFSKQTAWIYSDTTNLNPNITYVQKVLSPSVTKQRGPTHKRKQQFCRGFREFPSGHLEPVSSFCTFRVLCSARCLLPHPSVRVHLQFRDTTFHLEQKSSEIPSCLALHIPVRPKGALIFSPNLNSYRDRRYKYLE